MDGTNNATNTLHAYVQKIAESLEQVVPLTFVQPLFDERERRQTPFRIPTNLGVDGADAFSLEGIQYYKRAGVDQSFVNPKYLCDATFPWQLQDTTAKVLYPINLLAHQPVSQIDSAIWLLNQLGPADRGRKALVIFWVGNNDSSTAALGEGGTNPTFLPIPLEQVEPEITPALRHLLRYLQGQGDISFAPYTQASIERNLTDPQDFVDQYERLLTRLETEGTLGSAQVESFLLTLPYYSAVGYLLDSEDLEYYLRKLDPTYAVPPSFKRVTAPGEPITDPLTGDRVSLLTFGFMYALLHSGYSVEYVNQILELNGQQRDDLVLSEAEQQFIMARIDGFNAAIKAAVAAHGPHAHLVDIGQYLSDVLTGKTRVVVDGHVFGRKWVRGSSFTLDGVHPGYTGQALIANAVLSRMNDALGLGAPLYDLSQILATDPYIDHDGDGWAPGPEEEAFGFTELLFLFKDPNDADPTVQPQLPSDVWEQVSRILLQEILGLPHLRRKAAGLGVIPGTTPRRLP
jgi:hypothetical protein